MVLLIAATSRPQPPATEGPGGSVVDQLCGRGGRFFFKRGSSGAVSHVTDNLVYRCWLTVIDVMTCNIRIRPTNDVHRCKHSRS